MQDLQRFITIRRRSVSSATINRQMDFLARSLKHMADVHGASVPDLSIRKLRLSEPKERIRELSVSEQKRLFKFLRPDLHDFARFSLLTGARLSTIARLRWSDVDLETRRMNFKIKGGGEQRFPISQEMEKLLNGLPRSDDPEHSQFVFLYQRQNRKGQPWHKIRPNAGSLWDDFRKALAEAGIEDFRFHDMRHTFATRMLRQSSNLKLVSKLLGHSSIETTMRYAHVLDADLEAAVDQFSDTPKRRVPK